PRRRGTGGHSGVEPKARGKGSADCLTRKRIGGVETDAYKKFTRRNQAMKTKLVLGLSLLTLLISQKTASAAMRTWSGLGGNPFWNNTNNWVGHVRPAGTDDVVFASATPQMGTTNNWTNVLHSITFGAG